MGSKEAMVAHACNIAYDDSHGYSQADRWNVDRDCSSLMYDSANAGGYDIGRGPDATRYTGTMVRDFCNAGFSRLNFSEVGLGGLQYGDILLNVVHHTEMYIGNGKFVGAHSSETGGAYGQPGDQTGNEISVVSAYIYWDGWDYVLRPPADSQTIPEEEEMYPIENYGGDVYRLYNSNSGAHHFTTSDKEKRDLVSLGWIYEGVAWKALRSALSPVYRLYNKNNGDHFYCKDYDQCSYLVGEGWKCESVPWFTNTSGKPVYRLYNRFNGMHHYTADAREKTDLVAKGWNFEGIEFYAES